MRALPWLLGGSGLALGTYLWVRSSADGARSSTELPGDWVWPVATWAGRKPAISDGFAGTRRGPRGEPIAHGGVDLMFHRLPADPWRAGTPNGSRGWVMPADQVALAASEGVVWFAAQTPRGGSVIIDHSPRHLATYYTHLSSTSVQSKQRVRAGDPIGIIGADPQDGEHLMHLHFEIWRGNASTRFDPEPAMRQWRYVSAPIGPATLVAMR